jgi:hypothetical protein
MTWQRVNIKDSAAIQSLSGVQAFMSNTVSIMEGILSTTKDIIEFVSALVFDVEDLNAAVLQAAIDTARDVLKDLVGDAGCYYLPIPIRQITEISDAINRPTLIAPPDPGGAETVFDAMLPPRSTNMTGGNYGYLSDVMASLNDADDLMRPQFDQDAHIGALVVLAGVTSYLDIIPLIDKLQKLLSGDNGSAAGEGLVDTRIPKVTGLQYEIVPSVIGQAAKLHNRVEGGDKELPYAVKLSWDLHDKVSVTLDFGEPYRLVIDKVVIYRSDTPLSPNASLTERDTHILKEFEYDGTTNFFYDDTIELNHVYYYAVGYNVIGEQGSSTTSDLGVTYITALNVNIPNELDIFPRTGVPPDWTLLPNPLALIPGITDIVNTALVFLDDLEQRIAGKKNKYEKYIEDVTAQINAYVAKAEEITSTIRQIVELLTLPDVYLGATVLAGKGGNTFFMDALRRALMDTSDPNRPSFDRGDEIVTGFVLLAGSATAGKLSKFKTMLELLLSQTPSAAAAYAKAMGSINYVEMAVDREIEFLQNLDLNKTGVVATTAESLPAIGPDLEPAAEQNDGTECQEG